MRPIIKKKKVIKKRLKKICVICGKGMRVILYADRRYRGGHFFGKISLTTKKAEREAAKAGFRLVKFGDRFIQVAKKTAKPYGHFEYWECPRCYWRG